MEFSFSDFIAILALISGIGVPIYIADRLQNKFLKNTNLKTYHVKLLDDIFSDYKNFIEELIKGNYNKREIANKFKMFTIRFASIDHQNLIRFKISQKLQTINRQLQMFVTSSNEYNTTQTSGKVKLNNPTKSQIEILYSLLIKTNGDVIFELHK
ncbi:hypothetical protein MQX03_07640 [Chryseobacterium aahli]|uniref:hypothetical protein n=1 Tax=Chryseobacterium aahli TaxID=1278643 RepID=UPI001F60D2F7|nr:hypothetical protein [Chryseobacterium aahli]MCI3937068.1 hypothetical protein [Chryseobacterium aahli]